jgi:hypothetical protein
MPWSEIVVPLGTVFITAVSTLVAVFLTQRWENTRRRQDRDAETVRRQEDRTAEESRWFSDHFLSNKLDALRDFHAALHNYWFTVASFADRPATDFESEELDTAIGDKDDAYLHSLDVASLYLSDADETTLRDVLVEFRNANTALRFQQNAKRRPQSAPPPGSLFAEVDTRRLRDAYKNGSNCLTRLLNPPILRRLDEFDAGTTSPARTSPVAERMAK